MPDGQLLAQDRVLLLLALVPYLREHGPTPVTELAAAFGVREGLVRDLVRFLGTAGVPGETLSYQDEDLFDIDWDALEQEDVVSLTRIVAVDDAPRFAPAETAALLAGLHALIPVLPEADAEAARGAATKLSYALDAAGHAAPTVTADPGDPQLPLVVQAIEEGAGLAFAYRDAAGARSSRTADPISLTQAADVWYLRAHCRDRGAERTFRIDQMDGVRIVPGEPRPEAASAPPEPAGAVPLVARVAPSALARLRGFSPEVLAEEPDGRLRVAIEVWHPGAVSRLVRILPGEIEILAPESARDTVRDWAERTLAAYDD
ncbi:WYL domain-containing protein [Leucobacter allii]|uniref:WYL domain-containing protein n=1 Tax=Leucobacter allii TaxID=2932247 RepID=A0ABY4FQ96_9MICO|nr:WYL domain-containing protein [Leucobacter allii]UOQ58447.1 WYL domain-containing protein [Leucobacter allii]